MDRRDFYGYGNHRPQVRWPNGAGLALNFVVNVEEGAELSLADGDHANEPMHEVTSKVVAYPDLCRESHFEFGLRTDFLESDERVRRRWHPVHAECVWPCR